MNNLLSFFYGILEALGDDPGNLSVFVIVRVYQLIIGPHNDINRSFLTL
jgi:hypothetical protein